MKHLPALDGLRAIAVLAVVAYHAGLPVPAGFAGVDVFFVISGYLITRLLADEIRDTGRIDFLHFYARRARRILPAAVLVVVVTLVAAFVWLPSPAEVARSAGAAAVFVANLHFQSVTGGYWSDASDTMPLLHLWSLSVEEQFYLLWPLLLLLGAKRFQGGVQLGVDMRHVRAGGWLKALFRRQELLDIKLSDGGNVGGQSSTLAHVDEDVRKLHFGSHARIVPLLIFVVVASFVLAEALMWFNQTAAFYQMPARAWELAVGGLIALLHQSPQFRAVIGQEPVVQVVAETGPLGRAGLETVAPERLPLLVDAQKLGEGVVHGVDERSVFRVVRRRAEALIEKLSQRSHVNRHHEPRARLQIPSILRNPSRAVLERAAHFSLAIVLLSCFVPLPHFPGLGALPAVAGSALLIAAIHNGARVRVLELRPVVYVGLISYSLYLWHWPLLALDKALRVGESPLSVRLALCALAVVLAALSYRYVEQPFRRSRARSGRVVATGLACVVALSCTAFALANTQPAPKPVVVMSDTCAGPLKAARCVGKEAKVVLWGDSYAGAWESVAVSLAKSQGMVAVQMVETGCPPVLGVDVPRSTERASRFCRERAARDVAYLQANGADTLLVTAHWTRLLRERPDAGAGVVAWAKALPNVRRIVVVGPTPELPASLERCHSAGVTCEVSRAEFDAASAAATKVMRDLSALPNVEVLPLGDWLCDATTCPGVRDGVALYERDNHHVSRAAVAEFLRGRGLVGMAARQE